MKVVRPSIRRDIASTIKRSVCSSTALVGSSKDEQRRVLEERACQRDPLTFAARELCASRPDLGVVAVRQTGNELVSIGGCRRRR